RRDDRVSSPVVHTGAGALRPVLSRLSGRAAPLRQAGDGDGKLRGVAARVFAIHQRCGRFGRPAAEHLAPDAATGSTYHADPEMADEEGPGSVGGTVREGS